MTTATATRRLAAILAADVVGYSRLMGADEEGTVVGTMLVICHSTSLRRPPISRTSMRAS